MTLPAAAACFSKVEGWVRTKEAAQERAAYAGNIVRPPVDDLN